MIKSDVFGENFGIAFMLERFMVFRLYGGVYVKILDKIWTD